ncbi:MAG: molybdopterin molybdotransferase MoeA [Rhodospirillaceae bacterium]|nr:molybdopterin molybdotransferase MoeA [Rhodospirillaceae bacterium]MBT6117016.1 molybdopterin molybdotransferase MoeA [Rhodospirillaceae bacterium]
MAQLTDDCFAFGGDLMSAEEALARLRAVAVPVTETESVPLAACLGRILAEDVIAGRSVPPHDNSAVDGYALYFDNLASDGETVLPIAGRAAAGHSFEQPLRQGTALRIFTGAPMPQGAGEGEAPDTVLMQEDCREENGRVVVPPGIARGANRRKAGEDIAAGDRALAAGRRLRPQDIGLAASLGLTALPLRKPLRVALFSTGDELRDPGQAAPLGAVYDANRATVAALLAQAGMAVTDLGILPDRAATIRDALAEAAEGHDAVITSGGMSTGEEDHVHAAVEALGRLDFWRLAVKPGRPVGLGRIGRAAFIGLPGNPVAVMVTYLRFARPLLLGLAGCTETEPRLYPVRADFTHRKKAGRREWVRASLRNGPDGAPLAAKFPRDGAGILSSLVGSDGLVELGEAVTAVAPGDMVDFLPFSEVS